MIKRRRTSSTARSSPGSGSEFVEPAPEGLLGAMLSGDLVEWSRHEGGSLWLSYPAADLARHGVVVGEAGSGKTETLVRIAYLAAAAYRWQVVFLDAKGDLNTRDRFVAAMRAAGAPDVRVFPTEAYDGWRGDSRALVNRLMEVTDYRRSTKACGVDDVNEGRLVQMAWQMPSIGRLDQAPVEVPRLGGVPPGHSRTRARRPDGVRHSPRLQNRIRGTGRAPSTRY